MTERKRMLSKDERAAQATAMSFAWWFGWTGWIMVHFPWVFETGTSIAWPIGLGIVVGTTAVLVRKIFEAEYRP